VSREFLFVTDAADGIIRAAEVMDVPEPLNLGTGREITIRDLVRLIARLCEFHGEIRWDASKPNGQPRRCLETEHAARTIGWRAKTGFEEGLRQTIEWYRSHRSR
jgi:GDP-L-fucose synthase